MPAFSVHHTVVRDGTWDGPGTEASIPNDKVTKALAAKEWAWYEAGAPEDRKGTYKFPHHFTDGSGNPGAASAAGVRNGLARLNGASIPDADKAGVRSHLQAHLDDFNKNATMTPDELRASIGLEPVQSTSNFQPIVNVHVEMPVISILTAGKPWAIHRPVLEAMIAYGRDIKGARRLASPGGGPKITGQGVGLVDLKGMITPQGDLLSMIFGLGGGLDQFIGDLMSAVANPDVGKIVLNVDSPGGLVDMVPETAAKIRQAREQKPIVAVVNNTAGSAAYWLASQAHEVVVSPSGTVGSVGVYTLHTDLSQMLGNAGIKPTFIQAGKYKTEANEAEPLDPEAHQAMQDTVNYFYGMFVSDVANGRQEVVPQEAIDEGTAFGGGRMYPAKEAVKRGLADREASLEETVSRLSSGRSRVKRFGAQAEDITSSDDDGRPEWTSQEKAELLDFLFAA